MEQDPENVGSGKHFTPGPAGVLNRSSENKYHRRAQDDRRFHERNHTPDQRQFDGFTQYENNNRAKSQDRAMGTRRQTSNVVNLGRNYVENFDNRSHNSRYSRDRNEHAHSVERYSNH